MSNHVYKEAVLTEAATSLVGIGTVRTSSFSASAIDGTTIVLDGSRSRVRKASHYPALDMPCSILVPIDEQAVDAGVEIAARQAEAEEAFWTMIDTIGGVGRATAWVNLEWAGLSISTGRPDNRTLCAIASATIGFIVKHIQPQ